ncbi:MAG: NAD(+)/NADH kinase [Elusimicrobiota bacterium]
MIKKAAFFYNSKRESAIRFTESAVSFLEKHKIKTEKICVNKGETPKYSADIAISAGGDGTALYAARSLAGKSVGLIAVNAGGLGFLSSVEPKDFESFFLKVLKNKIKKIERFFLEIEGPRGKYYALNDCVLRSSQPRAFHLKVNYAGDFLSSYFGDGLIVSTPTGSTAYGLAAMGPIIMPSAQVFCLSPICPHTLTHRPVVLPADKTLEVFFCEESEKDISVTVSIDGQENFILPSGKGISVKKSSFSLITPVPLDYSWFKVLRDKLSWGRRR